MKFKNEIKTGIFISASLFILAALIFIMGRERQIFAKQAEYFASFSDVKGLSVGAPIRLGGITIGRVSHIGFSTDLNDSRVHVSLLINEDFLDRIRKDSVVSIETQGLLGDRFISISSGQELQQVVPGSILLSNEVADFAQALNKAQKVIDNTVEISDKVNKALEGVEPETFKTIGEVLKEIQTGKGFLHRLIYSEKDGAALMSSITKTSEDISAIVNEAKNGSGFMHALFYDPNGKETLQAMQNAASGLAEAGAGVNRLVEAATNGGGILQALFYGKDHGVDVAKDISEILAAFKVAAVNIKMASESLNSGTGTLGALLLDPRLYENLTEVTDGAKRSFILRQAIKSSLKQ